MFLKTLKLSRKGVLKQVQKSNVPQHDKKLVEELKMRYGEEFSRLLNPQHLVHPPPAKHFNCFAHAAGDQHWEDFFGELNRADNYYGQKGFVRDSNKDTRPIFGTDKIALWVDEDGAPNHAAKQTFSQHPKRGKKLWESKLGRGHIYFHDLNALDGPNGYGTVRYIYSKKWISDRPNYGLNLIQMYFPGGTGNKI